MTVHKAKDGSAKPVTGVRFPPPSQMFDLNFKDMAEFSTSTMGISPQRDIALRRMALTERGRLYEILHTFALDEDERLYIAYLAGINDSLIRPSN